MKLLSEISKTGRSAFQVPLGPSGFPSSIPADFLRDDLDLPEVSESDVIRHYVGLSQLNFGLDSGFYPLGSCTMKYNPKIHEEIARMSAWQVHPFSEFTQGSLRIIFELEQFLCEITGMHAFTLQPAAGAHGELTALMILKAYFEQRGENRTQILIPDTAHGTNPASAALCGFEPVQVASNSVGGLDLADLAQKMNANVAALMLTHPNTLGIFDDQILSITQLVHDGGGLCYMDGANMNALLGVVKPAELGFDLMHVNLHKTFSTPHGGGGPGAGPVGVSADLAAFLPNPRIRKTGEVYEFYDLEASIGRVHSFYGNFGVILKAYAYLRGLGPDGVRSVSENAVLNANYMKERLKPFYNLPYDRVCQHEFVLNDQGLPNHITTNDVAKRLLDYGFHPPTIYFPLLVPGAMMIEPTETESMETMDTFIDALIAIKKEAETQPDLLHDAPLTTPVRKVDGVLAARKPILK